MEQKWTYTEDFTVRGADANSDGVASPKAYACYLSDSSIHHADEMGYTMEELNERQIYWVLTNLHIKFYRYAEVRQKVTVRTWPVSVDRMYFRRDFEITSESGDRLAVAVSKWVFINVDSRKLERVPADIKTNWTPPEYRPIMDEPDWKIATRDDMPETGKVIVRLSDIDHNKHVNNAHYVDWAVQGTPCVEKDTLSEITLLYRTEAYNKAGITTKALEIADNVYLHGQYLDDGRELVRAKSIWK